ncbi:longevity assurance proteins LAG1/LAC1 [Abortiporus biennis]|nr:longevity assurance proteins LAG1/LAC1 [Abortiporus biennis]
MNHTIQQTSQWLPSFVVPFFTLSYPVPAPAEPDSFPNSNYYRTGILDGCFIITCIAVMAVLRDFTRLAIMEPFAKWWLTSRLRRQHAAEAHLANGNGHSNGAANGYANGVANGKANGSAKHISNGAANGSANGHAMTLPKSISKREAAHIHRHVIRFAEQGWSVIYYTYQFLFGIYIHHNLPTSVLNPVDVWLNYPHIPLAGPLKYYYLTQNAFYMHQILILNAEARRKDHWQMMTHHLITVPLMLSSYYYNYTRVGCLIMMLMDMCDIFLPLAKMLRYLSLSTLCDITFGCFLLSWLVTRHFLFVIVIKSTYLDTARLIRFVWEPERDHYMTRGMYIGFVTMLTALQIIQLMWFWMIVRVAYRVISGQGAEDTRSDSEDDGIAVDEEETKKDR